MKKRKELNLSDKIERIECPEGVFHEVCYTDAIKKFIHRVREGPKKNIALTIKNLHKWVDKLAGPKLTGDLK